MRFYLKRFNCQIFIPFLYLFDDPFNDLFSDVVDMSSSLRGADAVNERNLPELSL